MLQVVLEDTDMYMTESAAFSRAIQTGDDSPILTPFADAVRTCSANHCITAASYKDHMTLPYNSLVTDLVSWPESKPSNPAGKHGALYCSEA